jgi:hypothetical protein
MPFAIPIGDMQTIMLNMPTFVTAMGVFNIIISLYCESNDLKSH